jgi:hypothetical protein
MTRADIYAAIIAERVRQSAKWDRPHAHGWGDCSSPDAPTAVKVNVLTEEVGEVARAFLEGDENALRTELVQVAAVCVAALECPVLIPTDTHAPGANDVPLFDLETTR